MKTWFLLMITATLGLGIGWLWSYAETQQSVDLFLPEDYAARATKPVSRLPEADPERAPKVEVVGSAEYNFGSMDRDAKQQHTFRLKNVGQAPLAIEEGPTSCKCTVGEITNGLLEPGEIVEISVEWTGKTSGQVDFVQTVQIKTNDPDRTTVEFTIRGYVTETVRALPGELAVGNVSVNEATEATFRLFAFRGDHIQVQDATFDDTETAEYYDVSFQPLPIEEVQQEKGATAGLLGKLLVKPGLPLGPIVQTISLTVDVGAEAVVHIPVVGRTLSDIRIASSPQYNAGRNVLDLGVVPRNTVFAAALQIYVTGPHRDETHLSVAEVDPAQYLKVNISAPRGLNNGRAMQHTVTIEVQGGAESINRLGSETAPMGRVVLQTTHPQATKVPISVRFAVE